MTWKTKLERSQYHNMKLQSQIMNLLNSFKTLTDYVDDKNIAMSEIHTFKLQKSPTYDQMNNIDFYENFFVQELKELFDTIKKTEVLHKYDVKFTIKPKQDNKYNKVTKEKRKMLKK